MGCTYGNEYHKIMANITIVKLKVRRGSDKQRKEIILDQGEVGYTLDTRRLFVGDGATYGGFVAGNKNVGPFSNKASLGPAAGESPGLQVGDIGYAESRLYILTGASSTGKDYTDALSGWAYIGNVPDNNKLQFDEDNKLTVKKQSLDGAYLNSTFFGNGLLSSNASAQVALNSDYIILSSAPGATGRLTPKSGSITEREIKTLTGPGLQGGTDPGAGNSQELSLNVNEKQFKFDGDNKLELRSLQDLTIPVSAWAGSGDGTGVGGKLGGGLSLNTGTNQLQANLRTVDETLLTVNANGQITLAGAGDKEMEMPYLDTKQGLITEIKSSVFDVITATGLSGAGAGDGVPIGSILPHAQAFTTPPAGYLLCDGSAFDAVANPKYRNLFEKIGTVYGGTGMDNFLIPKLTGNDVMLYGAGAAIESTTAALYLSATDGIAGGGRGPDKKPPYNILSAFGVNFIIKYAEDPVLNIFNGAPNQVSNKFTDKYTQQVCYGLDSGSNAVRLSSAGFITMSLSGTVRNPANTDNNKFDRFAIPVYSY
jgi:hypothetical protein